MAPQITAAQARLLATAPGFRLRSDAANAWDRAVTAFGSRVLLTDAWRSYETQERIFRERYVKGNHRGKPGFTTDVRYWQGVAWTRRAGTAAAAVPGTSNHGSGLAVDVKTRRSANDAPYPQTVVFTSFNDPDRLRFLRVAKPHGWADDEGRSVNELWHLTYYPSRDTHPSVLGITTDEEDIVASLADLERTIDSRIAKRPWYKLPDTTLAWEDLGTARRAGSYQRFVAMGSPVIHDLDLDDSFWRLPIVGDPVYRELYKLPDDATAWALVVADGQLYREGIDATRYAKAGKPPIRQLPPSNSIWSLPVFHADE